MRLPISQHLFRVNIPCWVPKLLQVVLQVVSHKRTRKWQSSCRHFEPNGWILGPLLAIIGNTLLGVMCWAATWPYCCQSCRWQRLYCHYVEALGVWDVRDFYHDSKLINLIADDLIATSNWKRTQLNFEQNLIVSWHAVTFIFFSPPGTCKVLGIPGSNTSDCTIMTPAQKHFASTPGEKSRFWNGSTQRSLHFPTWRVEGQVSCLWIHKAQHDDTL